MEKNSSQIAKREKKCQKSLKNGQIFAKIFAKLPNIHNIRKEAKYAKYAQNWQNIRKHARACVSQP